MAIIAAKEKANLLVRQIGQSIGPAYTIREGTYTPYSTNNFSQNATSVAGSAGADSGSDGAIAPGQISVTAQVTVSFRLN